MKRILDRYVLGIFLPAVVVFVSTLLFLFIAVDFALKLGRFFALKDLNIAAFMLRFYGLRVPMLANIMLPTALLFAPSFTVVKLARSNEILPIAAAGISLRRMALPFVIAAILGGLTIAGVDEYVLPGLGEQVSEDEETLMVGGTSRNVEAYDGRALIWAKRFDMTKHMLAEEVHINRLDDTMQPIQRIEAKRCQWDAGRKRWVAFEGSVESPLELVDVPGSKPRTRMDPIPPEGFVIESDLTPDAIRKVTSVTNHFTFATMASLIEDMRRYPHVPSNVLKVHSRISFPLSPLVLVLLGLPFVMTPQAQSVIRGLVLCALVAVGYLMIHFTCLDLGNTGTLPPVWAAWLPVGSFGIAGLFSFSRMRT